MFGLHFIKNGIINENIGTYYTDIFDLRQTGDYDDFVAFDISKVTALIAPAKELIDTIEKIILTNRELDRYNTCKLLTCIFRFLLSESHMFRRIQPLLPH